MAENCIFTEQEIETESLEEQGMIINPKEVWEWAFSDFLTNSLRGVLAEYIVAKALNCPASSRVEWDAYDLKTEDGLRVEVKSSGYLQTWAQKRPSVIMFGIGKKLGWDASANTSASVPLRSADIYVFSIFTETRKELANPLDVSQWAFLLASSRFLDQHFKNQKTVTLSVLEKAGLKRHLFADLKEAFEEIRRLETFK